MKTTLPRTSARIFETMLVLTRVQTKLTEAGALCTVRNRPNAQQLLDQADTMIDELRSRLHEARAAVQSDAKPQ